MTKDEYPCLCGGTFFVLLLQAKKRTKKNNTLLSGNDTLSGREVLKELIKIADPNYMDPNPSTFKQNTSSYKSCDIAKGTYLPFDDVHFIKGFDDTVKTNYEKVLSDTVKFTERFIDIEGKGKWLVSALLELIEEDLDTQSKDFYIQRNGTPVSKANLSSITTFYLESFLLGIWHYIVVHVQDNMKGKNTFEQWHQEPDYSGSKWKFTSNIGYNLGREINVELVNSYHEAAMGSGNVEDTEVDADEFDANEFESENNEAEFYSDEQNQYYEEKQEHKTINQTINNPVIFQQSGNGNMQISHIETLNLNWRGGKG